MKRFADAFLLMPCTAASALNAQIADGPGVTVAKTPNVRLQTDSLCVPAFPGTEGFGAKATGGRGGRVIAVTNLNDSGPGSLREAIDANGPRIVVFRVSATIPLKSSLNLRHADTTIADQRIRREDGESVARGLSV